MGLDVPELDDRTFEELFEDARKRIPVHSKEWTDHNAHDPGITILETLAWLAETYTYQLDRVTDDHRRKHLQLLGVDVHPPQPATVDLQLAPQLPTGPEADPERSQAGDSEESESPPRTIPSEREGEKIPVGEKLIVDDGAGFTGVFETTKPVTLTRASIGCVVTDHRNGLTDNTTANETYGMRFHAFGERAARGNALYLGFDCDPFDAAEEDIVDVTVDYDDDDLPPVGDHPGDDVEFDPSVDLVWEYCADYEEWTTDSAWEEFEMIRDQTTQLYRGGTVAIRKTPAWTGRKKAILNQTEEFIWIRCRIETPGYEIPPRLNSVRLDVVPARHTATVEKAELERPDGGTETTVAPDQTFVFDDAPVLDATIEVGGERWEEVADFDASGPDDRHYVLDGARGEIRFGDGVTGTVPAPGHRVVAEEYVYGGGEGGNVPRSATCAFEREKLSEIPVSLMDGAEGGADAESVDAALTRLRKDLDTPYRAVSLEDYRRLAIETPGLRIARVETLVGSGESGHETIRVIVVPYSPLSKPQPSEGLLDAVRDHLDDHRLLTDRLRVEAPTYVGIGVETTIRLDPGAAEGGRIDATRAALDAFLEPLEETGDEGWPFGRPVYRSELYEVIEHVEGVDAVLDVAIHAGEAGERDPDGNVLIGDAALPYPDRHEIRVQRDAPGGKR